MTEEGRKEKERGQEHTQWGEVGEGEAVCGVSVTCPGGVAWVECAAQCVALPPPSNSAFLKYSTNVSRIGWTNDEIIHRAKLIP